MSAKQSRALLHGALHREAAGLICQLAVHVTENGTAICRGCGARLGGADPMHAPACPVVDIGRRLLDPGPEVRAVGTTGS